jgi:predicted nucleic acid-binding protein
MNSLFILDSCALIAFLHNENGSDFVSDLLESAASGLCHLSIHKINLLEVYYDTLRRDGKETAAQVLQLVKDNRIMTLPFISDEVLEEAGRLKAAYKISLADSIALAEARTQNASLVTCDHHEFDPLEQTEPISFLWIR